MTRRTSRSIVHAVLIALIALVLVGCRDSGEPTAPGRPGDWNITVLVEDTQRQPATVRRIIDGDTITVEPSDRFPATYNCYQGTCKEHAIRLLGIDAPETNSRSGEQPDCGAHLATSNLAALLLDNDTGVEITVVTDSVADPIDRYGRTLAYVEVDGIDAGGAQVSGGFAAAWYPRGEPEPDRYAVYLRDQLVAEHNSAGLYAQCDRIGRD